MSETLFISDLHLAADRPELTTRFINFLQTRASRADNLYILGDLFDAWIGDDDDSDLSRTVQNALRTATDQGLAVHLQHGNRDFLIGNDFLNSTGCSLLDETAITDLNGKRTLLMHGDLLCTDDREYQQARVMLRTPAFIDEFLSKSLVERALLAQEYRKRSGEAMSQKAEDIMDANPDTVIDYLQRHAAQLLIHGHTHRQGEHSIQLDDGLRTRYVLGDWHDEAGSVLSDRDGKRAFETV